MSRAIDQIVRDFCREAEVDYVGLWQVVSAVVHDYQVSSPADIRRLTMEIVRGLLASGFEAVDLRPGGGRIPWADQRLDVVLARIDHEWDALGKEPDVGDIVWFDLPERNGSQRKGA
jgi:hypothetical protein